MIKRGFALIALLLLAPGGAAPQNAVLDNFDTGCAWQAVSSEGVSGTASCDQGRRGQALRLDFNFNGHNGFASARKNIPLDLQGNFEITFWIRAEAPVNNFEFKLVDASSENVWWKIERDYAFPTDWTRVRIPKRMLDFAWGPLQDHTLTHTASLEFVVSRGAAGGTGRVWIDELEIHALPPEGAPLAPAHISASGSMQGFGAAHALDGDTVTAWRATGNSATLSVDFGVVREFGGLQVLWEEGAHARAYEVQTSDDGRAWNRLRAVANSDGGRDPILATETATRYLRLVLTQPAGRFFGLRELQIELLQWGADRTSFVRALASEAPRGTYPRGFSEQNYWTLVGAEAAENSALISEDGAIEIGKGQASIEPFVREGDRLFGWADVQAQQSLQDNYLPIPAVQWRAADWRLITTAFADGDARQSTLVARYDLTNTSDAPKHLELVLALRPFQVNGPMQFLNVRGGAARISHVEIEDRELRINDAQRVTFAAAPSSTALSSFDSGLLPFAGGGTAAREVTDETGFASAAARFDLMLAPGETRTIAWSAPLTGAGQPITRGTLDERQAALAQAWRTRLNQVDIRVPQAGQVWIDTMKTSLAHILMSRRGPILQPGTRSYNRSWIRDGAMISDELMRLGAVDVAQDYLEWFAPFQFASGKIPCCADERGSDPVSENDSHGEYIFLVASVWRATHDEAQLRRLWPSVERAIGYMDALRASEQAKNQTPDRRHLYGLLPASISHEGYSSNPAYSYWDDFWGLLGYKEAVNLAEALGLHDEAGAIALKRDAFRADLYASLAAMSGVHGIDFIPGAADLGDFDPTSTTIAFTPTDEWNNLSLGPLRNTFERYWREVASRRVPGASWQAYTPYEIRNVGAFVRLGWRARAGQLMQFFIDDRRPAPWNGWPEVIGRQAREMRFIGDMPHAWISSDYIRSLLDMFAYARGGDQNLVIAAGVPESWLDGAGVSVRDLRTPYGRISYTLRRAGNSILLEIKGDTPPGGFVLPWPIEQAAPTHATFNGRRLSASEAGFVLHANGLLSACICAPHTN